MAKSELDKLITQFEESSAYVNELTSNLSSFSTILKSVKDHVQPISDVKVFLNDSNILKKVDDLSMNTLEVSTKLKERISTIDGYVDNVKGLSENYSGNVTELLGGLKHVTEQIDKFNKDVAPFAKTIEKQLARIIAIDPEKAAKLITQQLAEYTDQVVNNYSNLSTSIDSLNEENASHQVAMTMNYREYRSQLSTNYKNMLKDQHKTGEKISEVLQLHISLNKTLSLIEEGNVEPLDHFNELCDRWAEENIYKSSLRKRGILYRAVIRIVVIASVLLNIELLFNSPVVSFFSNAFR